ncbi:MAG TPA: GatB/YqeY domain-containing protein [Syntrophorhabdaceae bacterium]|nr:GatB/YqeY domain-containing protein [Syntrophorhabdaceae bacterium]HOL04955.1 GatB/YqeY domain-containing protein [Syntrophorhabdaceae bacterium]HON85213.1 GatB/YqeY domain-containing protein [Syntrophorhabdaceae bacterium]HOT42856.1 GatB/YqeY domain-containing protein [Syntrophorhabdaceae bacterium]HPC66541.1 GatB/YqeY domain-containing protein [Syntrophorhabdaceae bacterium]
MEFKSKIEQGLKDAIKNRDTTKVSTYRMLLAAIKNKEVEKIRPITEEEFFSIVRSSVKQRLESIEGFKKGNRQDLIEKEEKELELLKELLPASLSEEQLVKEIDEAILSLEVTGKKDMGKVIKFLLGKYPGRIDGKVLSELVLKRLSSK